MGIQVPLVSSWATPLLSAPYLLASSVWTTGTNAWHIAAGLLGTIAVIVLIRLNLNSIWRSNAEGYKAELALRDETHQATIDELTHRLQQLDLKIADQDKEISNLVARTDLTPLLALIPLVHDIHKRIAPTTDEGEGWHE